jgi:NAD(P)H-nitrite reductase large subunit
VSPVLVCHCHGVNDAAVSHAVETGCSKVGQVVRTTRAGTGCGGCIPELKRLCSEAVSQRMANGQPALLHSTSMSA